MKALIDGDPPVYACGFAAEGEELSHALHNVKRLINNVLKATGADEYSIFLTGKNNYREEVATIVPYKGNRDPSHKPTFYQDIRDYMENVHDAKVVDDMEADDALGIVQYQTALQRMQDRSDYQFDNTHDFEETIICTIDKDLDMIPGWHYNWKRDEKYFVTYEEGEIFFYTQLLTGDPVDNIKGVPKIGPVKAKKILDGATTEVERFNRVRMAYVDYQSKLEENEGISEKEILEKADAQMKENATLLWIRRSTEDAWNQPESMI